MSEKNDNRSALLGFLYEHEIAFNEELHLLSTGKKKVECYPEDAVIRGYGWIVTWSDSEAGEWHLAHAFGKYEDYLKALDLLPHRPDIHLLVPQTDAPLICAAKKLSVAERLIWYRDSGIEISVADLPHHSPKWHGLEFVQRWETADGKAADAGAANYLALYYREESSVVALAKCIHITPNTAEVYVETAPHRRGMGLASGLIKEMLRQLRFLGLTMLYVVSSENEASLSLAGKVGLEAFQALTRIPFIY